jgi:hypothetical protein
MAFRLRLSKSLPQAEVVNQSLPEAARFAGQ